MSKKAAVQTPWVNSTECVPNHKQRVVIDYVTKESRNLVCVGCFDNTRGWMLHETMQLPEGWVVYNWMPIPEVLPF